MKKYCFILKIISVFALLAMLFILSSFAKTDDANYAISATAEYFNTDFLKQTVLRNTFRIVPGVDLDEYYQKPVTVTKVINNRDEYDAVFKNDSVTVDLDKETLIVYTYMCGYAKSPIYVNGLKIADRTAYVDLKKVNSGAFDGCIHYQRYLIVKTDKLDVDSAEISIEGRNDPDGSVFTSSIASIINNPAVIERYYREQSSAESVYCVPCGSDRIIPSSFDNAKRFGDVKAIPINSLEDYYSVFTDSIYFSAHITGFDDYSLILFETDKKLYEYVDSEKTKLNTNGKEPSEIVLPAYESSASESKAEKSAPEYYILLIKAGGISNVNIKYDLRNID